VNVFTVEALVILVLRIWEAPSSIHYPTGSQPFMLHVPPGNVYVTGVPLV
jgi:hypothetical protein